ncbi:helix-turn-helix domain-containing protein [Streptomonospora salina]|uniref:DNA-binding Xre family transcriptional regulator n=1 Tax=Streptomonospora salina TaxID=104205 RepID=A0A841EAI3_9ACTN|nr:helix-turn-helix domain-containing protein [Streptomonospora salina]MBB6000012.1 DNA-binding Xre family transcriptional regulator [Streptomonospora salina]
MDWIVDVLDHYIQEVRPLFGPGKIPALWVTERRSRLSRLSASDAFETARQLAGLPGELDLHALRHSYVTHLVEFDYPERFVSEQVGHSYASTTAIYAGVFRRLPQPPAGTLPQGAPRRAVGSSDMNKKMGYRWHLRRLMAAKEILQTTDLVPLLADRGINLSREQIFRLVTQLPQRLSMDVLADLCDILDCTPNDLIEVEAVNQQVSKDATTGNGPPAPGARRTTIRRSEGL